MHIRHSKLIAAVCMEILCAAELDIFVSGLPQIQNLFHLSTVEVELMLVTNLIAGAIAAFVVGNFSDKYGSKKIILGGLYIFVLGTILCIFAESYFAVLLGRMIEGVGIAGPGVLSYVVIAEEYKKSDQPRLMAFMNGCITIVMIFIPIIGSHVNSTYGWRYNFGILLFFALILIGIVELVLSHCKKNSEDIQISLKAYIPIVSSKSAIFCIIAISLLSSVYWVFIGMAPIFYVEVIGISIKDFGYHQSFVVFTFGILCLCSGFLMKKYGVRKCFMASIIFASICAILISLLGIFDTKNAMIITVICAFAIASLTLPINIIYPLSLDIIPNTKGRMASLIRSFRLLISGCMIHITSYYYNSSFSVISFMICIILVCGLYYILRSWLILKVEIE